jgi:5-deoxy-5-amino-3-dehydroquinate synthase
VAIGLVFAAHLAHRLGRIDDGRVAEHRAVVAGYDLPVKLPPGVAGQVDDLVDAMARDKKAIAGHTFVLDGPRGVEVVREVERNDIVAALKELA